MNEQDKQKEIDAFHKRSTFVHQVIESLPQFINSLGDDDIYKRQENFEKVFLGFDIMINHVIENGKFIKKITS